MLQLIKLASFILIIIINFLGWLMAYPLYVMFNIIDSRSLKEAYARSKFWGKYYER